MTFIRAYLAELGKISTMDQIFTEEEIMTEANRSELAFDPIVLKKS